MKIQFTGTGSGKTSLKRFHSSFLISENNNSVLVDCGDGISKALLLLDINFTEIDSIIISHLHPDHYTGLPLLISQMKMNKRTNELKVFIHISSQMFIKNFLKQSYLFEEKLGFNISLIPFNHDEIFQLNDSIECLSKQNSHLDKYIKYDRENALSFMSSSFLFKTKRTSLMYTGDVGCKDDLMLFDSSEYEYLISEITHISFDDLVPLIYTDRFKKIYLTHISDEDDSSIINSISSMPPAIKNKIIIAYDGLNTTL